MAAKNPLQDFITSLQLKGNLPSNAWDDIKGMGSGVLQLGENTGQRLLQGDLPQNVLSDTIVGMGKGTVDEFGNLIGATNYKDAPLLDPSKSIFEPGGINTQGLQNTFQGANKDPGRVVGNVARNAIQHAYQKPVTTALDLLTIKNALKGGKASKVEQAVDDATPDETIPNKPQAPSVPDSAVKSFLQKYTVPTKRAGANDLNVAATSREILEHAKSGMNLDNVDAIPDQVTGQNGLISKMTRDAVGKIPGEISATEGGKSASNILDGYKVIIDEPTRQAVVLDINRGIPVGAGVTTSNPLDALDYARQLESKASQYARQSTYLTPNLKAEVIAKAYSSAADDIMNQIDTASKGQSLSAIKTPEVLSQLNDISPRLAQQVAAARDVSELRSVAAPFVRLSKMADLTENAANSAFMKLAGSGSRGGLGIGPATLAGGGLGSMLGPMGTAGGAALGNVIDRAAAPLYDAAMSKIATPINNMATGAFLNAPNMAGDLGAAAKVGSAMLPAISSTQNSQSGGQSTLPPIAPPASNAPMTQPLPMALDKIPQSIHDIKPDQTGNYQVANPFTIKGTDGQALALSSDAYQNQIQQLNAQKASPQYINNPYFKNDVDQQLSSLQSKKQLSDQLGQAQNQASSMNDIMSEARTLLKGAPVNILSLNPTTDKLKKAFNGQYAQLAQDLDIIEKAFPGVSLYGQTGGSALGTLNGANQKMLNSYYKAINQYTGGQGQNNKPVSVGSQLPPQAPVNSAPAPAFNWTGGQAPSLGNLPAIQ